MKEKTKEQRILEYAESRYPVWFSRADICKELGLSNTESFNSLKWLYGFGDLEKKNVNGKTFKYRYVNRLR